MKNNNFSITTTMLAKICGVSQGTVDRALNGRAGIKAETREKILIAARKYGYIEGLEQETQAIGIVVFDLYNDYFAELVMCFEEECKKCNKSLVVMFTGKSKTEELRCIKRLYYMGVSGIVLCPVNNGSEFENFLNSMKIPVVTVGNKLDNISYVGIDNGRAMYDACDLFSSENKKIVYYSIPMNSDENKYAQVERQRGFECCAKKKGIEYVVANDFYTVESYINKNEGWSVMCSTDHYMRKIRNNHPDVPIMGFDNIYTVGDGMTVDVNSQEVARQTIYNFEHNINEDVIVPHRIVKR